jgi:DNA-binding MarR family transcriptional regulator
MKNKEYTVKELAELSGKTTSAIYAIIKRIGRMPTLEEVKAIKNGRPNKYSVRRDAQSWTAKVSPEEQVEFDEILKSNHLTKTKFLRMAFKEYTKSIENGEGWE